MHDLFDWTNSGVGLTGLALTVGALWQATGAKTAAREARRAVYLRNTSDDVKRLERYASSLLTAIEAGNYGLAAHCARDFIADCLDIREHHRERLGRNGGKLDLAFGLVRTISKEVLGGAPPSSLIESAQKVVGEMSGLSGILSRGIEEEER